MPAAKKPEKQVMDVSKPGKVPAEPSARPVIVGHRPLVQDPMVTSPEASNPDESQPKEEAKPVSPSAGKKVIVPLSEQADEATENGEATAGATEDAVAATEEQPAAAEEAKPEESSGTSESTDSISESAVVDSVLDQVDIGTKREEEQKAEEERKKAEALEKLIAEKKYFVPLGKTHGGSSKGVWVVCALIVLVLFGAILAADAGFIKGVSVPVNLIKDSSTEASETFLAPASTTAASADTADKPNSSTADPEAAISHDTERQSDINKIHSHLENYFNQYGNYPTRDQINDKMFRAERMNGLDEDSLMDPAGMEATLVASAVKGSYSYEVLDSGGGRCDNQTNECSTYTLTATLNTGTYAKEALN